MYSPADTSEVLTFKLPADFQINVLLIWLQYNKLICLFIFIRCKEKELGKRAILRFAASQEIRHCPHPVYTEKLN